PYYSWLLRHRINQKTLNFIEIGLSVLDSRLKKEEIPKSFKKPIPNVGINIYKSGIPKFKEACNMLMVISGIEHPKLILDLIKVMYIQGVLRAVSLLFRGLPASPSNQQALS
ncbi:MAG: hypothetical protein HY717_14280, partial [Planctomycetes bacterium]|nr:hypothetical protein [Planctomycetota bacterium]